MNNKVIDELVEQTLYNMKETKPCKNCFCNDLCYFLLIKTGIATSCNDFKSRVRKVVDREIEKEKLK